MFKEIMSAFGLFIGALALVFALAAFGFGMKWVFWPAEKKLERKVLVESHQYKEGMEQRALILEANIAEIDALIAIGRGDTEGLRAQRSALEAQLKATRR